MDFAQIKTLHTLGPSGTNCEAAAWEWARRRQTTVEVILHPTLETAIERMAPSRSEALLACIVYPQLHSLVFSNLDRLQLIDCFVMPTYRMVVASRGSERPTTIACHPAPRKLIELVGLDPASAVLVNSNVVAGESCANLETEGCVTTRDVADRLGLRILRDFGPVPMGFSVHVAPL